MSASRWRYRSAAVLPVPTRPPAARLAGPAGRAPDSATAACGGAARRPPALGEEVGREEAFHEVVDPPIAVAPRRAPGCPASARASRIGADLVRRVASTSRSSPRGADVGGGERAVSSDPVEQLLDEIGVFDEGALRAWPARCTVPGDAIPRQLGGRQRWRGPCCTPRTAIDRGTAGRRSRPAGSRRSAPQDEVVIAAGDLERVELEATPAARPRSGRRRGPAGARAAGARRWRATRKRRAVARSIDRGSGIGRWYQSRSASHPI